MKHKPKIYNVDIDGTLTYGTAWTAEECLNAKPRLDMIEKINKLYLFNDIVIYTARREDLYIPTMTWLRKWNVHYHSTNFATKPPGIQIDLDAINRIENL